MKIETLHAIKSSFILVHQNFVPLNFKITLMTNTHYFLIGNLKKCFRFLISNYKS